MRLMEFFTSANLKNRHQQKNSTVQRYEGGKVDTERFIMGQRDRKKAFKQPKCYNSS